MTVNCVIHWHYFQARPRQVSSCFELHLLILITFQIILVWNFIIKQLLSKSYTKLWWKPVKLLVFVNCTFYSKKIIENMLRSFRFRRATVNLILQTFMNVSELELASKWSQTVENDDGSHTVIVEKRNNKFYFTS